MKKIVFTGSNGLIGQNLTNKLCHDYLIYKTDSNNLDFTNLEDISNFIKRTQPTHLIHLAAFHSKVDDVEKEKKLGANSTIWKKMY